MIEMNRLWFIWINFFMFFSWMIWNTGSVEVWRRPDGGGAVSLGGRPVEDHQLGRRCALVDVGYDGQTGDVPDLHGDAQHVGADGELEADGGHSVALRSILPRRRSTRRFRAVHVAMHEPFVCLSPIKFNYN